MAGSLSQFLDGMKELPLGSSYFGVAFSAQQLCTTKTSTYRHNNAHKQDYVYSISTYPVLLFEDLEVLWPFGHAKAEGHLLCLIISA